MNNKRRGLQAALILLIAAMLISACEQSLSSAPVATSTVIPEGLFVSPFPSVENPMAMIEEFAKQTAAAQTATAGGIPDLPEANQTETVITPQPGDILTSTPDQISTPTNAEPSANIQPAATLAPGARPATYTLQKGEWPWCIARRFDVNPNELLRLSGLTISQANILAPGTVLTIPQSGSFPPPRNLLAHPATYSVASSAETIYGIACKYGDVDPNAIAAANSIAVSASLTVGQQLQIP
jgi:LysM repeat protein